MKELRVVLGNKTILTTGRKGPDFTPFKETPANLLKEMTNAKPTPVFKYADNLGRAITVEELKTMLKITDAQPKKEIKIEEPTIPTNTDITGENGGTGEMVTDPTENPEGTEGEETGEPAGTKDNQNQGQQNGQQSQKINKKDKK